MSFQSKIRSRGELVLMCKVLKAQGKKIGFTSGAFDLLHPGHVDYLDKAKAECDVLIVGLNSDSSIKSYKSPIRPISLQGDRARVLAALESIDYVFIFDETNNNKNIEELQPDIYLKAEDYKDKKLSSKPLVEAYGGKVMLVPFLSGYSTTKIVERIAEAVLGAAEAQEGEIIVHKKQPAIFVDRDGTLIEHVEYLHETEKFKPIPGALEALKKLKDVGYRIVVITNQPGIGLGYFSKEDFFRVNKELLRAATKISLEIDRVYFCPHSLSEHCECRKPKIGMIERARQDLNIDLENSFVVGDSSGDILCGRNAGCRPILVGTGLAGKDGVHPVVADLKVEDMAAAAEWILKNHKRPELTTEPGSNDELSPDSAVMERIITSTLEGIGRISAKFGHDFNNLLGSIRGCVDLINSRMEKLHPDGNPIARQLNLIDASVNKAVSLTNKMRGFVRPGPLETSHIPLRKCIEQVIESLKESSKDSVNFTLNLTANPVLDINGFQVSQMLISLCVNSVEAMHQLTDPHIVFHLEKISIAGDELGVEPGEYARLCVIDHGEGIAPEVRTKLYEPFFSTNPGGIGKGMGLSLSMARETMRRHKGAITISSIPNCGTTVQLYFPIPAEQ